MQTISIDMLKEFAEALATNTTLEVFSLCNTRASDKVAKVLKQRKLANTKILVN